VSRLTGSGVSQTLQVQGLAALQRDLNKIVGAGGADTLRKRLLQPALKELGEITANEARSIAKRRFVTKTTGKMVKQIQPSVVMNAVYVQSRATRMNSKSGEKYRYPAVYEYGGRDVQKLPGGGLTEIRRRSTIGARLRNGGKAQGEFGEFGPNAVLYPAFVKTQPLIEKQFIVFMERFLRDVGLN
jgi:hypothetical protein